MAQTLRVMLWKMLILRKRRWIISLLEVIIPIFIFGLLVYFKNLMPDDPQEETITANGALNKYQALPTYYYGVITEYQIAYAPSNVVTDTIMNSVFSALNESLYKVTYRVFDNETAVVDWLKQQYIDESKNYTGNPDLESQYTPGVGVVFKSGNDTESLSYVIRTTRDMQTSADTLYGETSGFTLYWTSGFAVIQSLIDQAFLTQFYNINVTAEDVNTVELPYMSFGMVELLSILLPFLVTLSFTFVMPSLLRGIVDEKVSGVREMMRIMGLSSFVNWLNWLMYAMIVYIPVTLIITGELTIDFSGGAAFQANFFLVWIIFILFTLSFVSFVFALSTFFTNGTIAIIVGQILWYTVSLVLDSFVTMYPDNFSLEIHMVTCLWPSIALIWALNTISNFQKNGSTWTIGDLFDDGAGGGRPNVGLAVIMMIVDIVIFSLITWYIDSVNPGPYGSRKPFTFIFQCFKSKQHDSGPTNTSRQRNYETPPEGVKVGIKIENLRKSFKGGKVVAVENVDLDVYEGNITALLGHNGAGKTTTMSILTGFLSPSGGQIIFNGENILNNMAEFRSSLGLCPQHNLLFTFFTVREHLIFFGMLKGLTMKEAEEEGLALLGPLKMEEKKNELVSKLSGGMKRKLCLCISLMGSPKVLVLDEPTSGLDPESRRHVWDLLLSYRGQRTILISTHFMEEADVLGDRIAIMDHGVVSCYGTSIFLKKTYGTGYQLNITKKDQAPINAITTVIEQHVTSATVKVSSDTELSYNIKSDEASCLPLLFAALERWTDQLGITGTSITGSTLEDVFLKVAEKPHNIQESNGHVDLGPFYGKMDKVSGLQLVTQHCRALIYKRLLTRLRTWITTVVFIVLSVALVALHIFRTMQQNYTSEQPEILLQASQFPLSHIAAQSDNANVSGIISSLVNGTSSYDIIPASDNFNTYYERLINSSLVRYERQQIIGIKYNSSYLLGGYSTYFDHSLGLVLNMLANIMLQLVNPAASITTYNHPIAVKSNLDICDISELAAGHIFLFPMHATFTSLGLLILIMSFISFPLKERVSKAKQLQLMAGVSPSLYWLVIFACDMVVYLFTAVLMVGMVCIFEKNHIYTLSGYMGTLFLLFVLFGVSGIAYAYFFSFFVGSSVKASVVFMMINLLLGTIGGVFLAIMEGIYTNYVVYRVILNFNPIFAMTYGLTRLLQAMYINGACLACGGDCSSILQDPLQFMDAGLSGAHPYGINNFLIFLAVDAAIYIFLVMAIEYGLIKKLWFHLSQMWIKFENDQLIEDRDVLVENEKVYASHSLKGHFSNSSILSVNALGKKYNKKSVAVHSVSFQVGQGECFGLLGVNGAGKTTTFKMLTGEEIPNKGDARVQHYSLRNDKSQFLSHIGYCPQFDAINKLLSARELLYVYGLIRGIPADYCHSEVSRWIQIMGLKEYADRPCGTYSGGNKRKLSTAMAFIGEPPVVFLDEPTSGVDPVSRRKLWDIVAQSQQAGQAIVLTSHSMEECEALCSRLTIMVAGQMKCIGSAQYLKQKFGQGYTVKVKLRSLRYVQSAVDLLKRSVHQQFPTCQLKDEHLGLLHYHLPDTSLRLSTLFTKLESLRRTHELIEDYVVSDTSLEEVFMSFARLQQKLEQITEL